MATATATAVLEGHGLRFLGRVGSGHSVLMDDAEGDRGPRPAELLMVALAGCTAMDVVSILRKKRQPVSRYEVRVAGERREEGPPHVFTLVRVVHVVDGDLDVDAVRRAVELSATRHCTVSGNLASGIAQIHHSYLVRDARGEEHCRTVVVTGPFESVPGRALDRASRSNGIGGG